MSAVGLNAAKEQKEAVKFNAAIPFMVATAVVTLIISYMVLKD